MYTQGCAVGRHGAAQLNYWAAQSLVQHRGSRVWHGYSLVQEKRDARVDGQGVRAEEWALEWRYAVQWMGRVREGHMVGRWAAASRHDIAKLHVCVCHVPQDRLSSKEDVVFVRY
jgi:hypothetical protein